MLTALTRGMRIALDRPRRRRSGGASPARDARADGGLGLPHAAIREQVADCDRPRGLQARGSDGAAGSTGSPRSSASPAVRGPARSTRSGAVVPAGALRSGTRSRVGWSPPTRILSGWTGSGAAPAGPTPAGPTPAGPTPAGPTPAGPTGGAHTGGAHTGGAHTGRAHTGRAHTGRAHTGLPRGSARAGRAAEREGDARPRSPSSPPSPPSSAPGMRSRPSSGRGCRGARVVSSRWCAPAARAGADARGASPARAVRGGQAARRRLVLGGPLVGALAAVAGPALALALVRARRRRYREEVGRGAFGVRSRTG